MEKGRRGWRGRAIGPALRSPFLTTTGNSEDCLEGSFPSRLIIQSGGGLFLESLRRKFSELGTLLLNTGVSRKEPNTLAAKEPLWGEFTRGDILFSGVRGKPCQKKKILGSPGDLNGRAFGPF